MLKALIEQLQGAQTLETELLEQLLEATAQGPAYEELRQAAHATAVAGFGHKIYIRGLIEISNYCRNNCLYCGIRAGNPKASRYRLDKATVLSCCKIGYELGFRTFVLQGGEDMAYDDRAMTGVIEAIKNAYPECAITLSLGERERDQYAEWFKAGGDRYLLRHETATPEHYAKLHPASLSLDHRKACLYTLKDLGYQVGTGFMVGSPYQTRQHLIADLQFIDELKPHMIGIGPFIPHRDTPFRAMPGGTARETLQMLAILRLRYPRVLLPATTALGTIEADGRLEGILSGANVIMPNLSPAAVRSKYSLYNNKLATGCEAAENLLALRQNLGTIGYDITVSRGDYNQK